MKHIRLLMIALAICATAWACGQPTAGPSAAPAADATIKIGALFAVTGPAANLGGPEKNTAEMLVAQLNARGGINGKKVELIVRDTAGDPEKAVSFCQQLINEDKVFAIIGPSTSGETLKIVNLCQDNKVILISCAAAEKIVNPVLSYVFKSPQNDRFAAQRIYATMKSLNISRIGVIASNTGFGKGGREQLENLAASAGITIAIAETYEKEATDLTALLTKVKNANVQAVVNWSIEPAQSIVAKNMRQLGFNVPLFQSHGFGNIAYVTAAGAAAEGIIFPCGRLLVAEILPDSHPQRALLLQYKRDYEAQFNEAPSTFGGHAYDAILILKTALEKAGEADGEKVRAALEQITGLVGTAGVFNFSATDHNGLAADAFAMLTVRNGQFALYQP